jgi:cytochrome c oxidase subunit 1
MASISAARADAVRAPAQAARFATEQRIAAANVLVAFAALAVGGLMGLFQVLAYNKINLYPYLAPVVNSYYQGLSIHGVLNVLVFTTFFIVGFLTFTSTRSLDRPLWSRRLGWVTFWVMLGGVLMAAVPLLTNRATVLFTFYPPLRADSLFYIGLTLVVVGTWLLLVNLVFTYRQWRAENPGTRTPLAAFMALITMAMWTIATVGIASEMLFLLIPWSLGLVGGTDPILARTLFWFTGHPIVYFWLLPAYVSWYTLVPRQAGGKLFSDPMARVSFLLFLILSVPIGMHHQITDPGISEIWKLVHAFFTFAVFFPSLLTFFNVIASLESGGRARGGKGWLAWILKLPWGDPSFSAQVLSMILFAFGGIGGLINASYNINLVIHNTAWVPGHFHLTVGSAVALTFMGIAYWLVPFLSGRALWSRRLGVAQGWLWFVGMAIFSHWMHTLGLLGMPRRTQIGAAPYLQPEWAALLPIVAIGGVIMVISAACFYLNMIMTLTVGKRTQGQVVPFASAISGPEDAPALLDRWRPWLIIAGALILLNYVPTLYQIISTSNFDVPGLRPW